MEDLDLKPLFGGCYSGCRVLVTGHTGFKGSWLALWLKAMGAEVAGLSLEPETEPAHWHLLGLDLDYEAKSDLRDASAVHKALADFRPTVVMHLAAQALVRRAYREPVDTYATNVLGLVNLLEAVRASDSVRVVVNATTDKVYEPHQSPTGHLESDALGGHDPYSTSKACAELVTTSYRRSYFDVADARPGTQVATARAGNVIGGGDWAEDRLIPDLVRSLASGSPLRLRNPLATRPWQHVLEPLSGYLRIGQSLLSGAVTGDSWNLGPAAADVVTVADVVNRLKARLPGLTVQYAAGPHPHEAAFLALDCTKAERELAWSPVWGIETSLQRTADWYGAFLEDGRVLTGNDLRDYVDDARAAGLSWAS